jgi:Icc-related predicted phosphoesterase
MMHRVAGLLLLSTVLARPSVAQGTMVSGVVYADANGNGRRDPGERGIPGVAVSNQDTVVTTDNSGAYRLTSGASAIVFVSLPDGFRAATSFWKRTDSGDKSFDFPLVATPKTAAFSFIHASDTHIAPAVVARTQRLRAMSDSIKPALVLITGDLVKDALRVGEAEATGYYELFNREIALFKQPVWTVPGNHENFGIERQLSKMTADHPLYGRRMYYKYRGPDYYSFTYGGVHFVGLNTVDIEDQWYYGHVDSLQLAWLERDLALIPPSMPVVTFDHIPFFSSFEGLGGYKPDGVAPSLINIKGKPQYRHTVSNSAAVLATLRRNKHVLALGGHIHATEKIAFETEGVQTRFNQTPAIVGPSSGSGMRFRSGFTLYRVRDGNIDAGTFVPLDADTTRSPARRGGAGR